MGMPSVGLSVDTSPVARVPLSSSVKREDWTSQPPRFPLVTTCDDCELLGSRGPGVAQCENTVIWALAGGSVVGGMSHTLEGRRFDSR